MLTNFKMASQEFSIYASVYASMVPTRQVPERVQIYVEYPCTGVLPGYPISNVIGFKGGVLLGFTAVLAIN